MSSKLIDTAQYFPKIHRKDFTVALNLQTSGPDPDPIVGSFYGCGASLNWDGLLQSRNRQNDRSSNHARPICERRKRLLWSIERKLAEDNARPIIFY